MAAFGTYSNYNTKNNSNYVVNQGTYFNTRTMAIRTYDQDKEIELLRDRLRDELNKKELKRSSDVESLIAHYYSL